MASNDLLNIIEVYCEVHHDQDGNPPKPGSTFASKSSKQLEKLRKKEKLDQENRRRRLERMEDFECYITLDKEDRARKPRKWNLIGRLWYWLVLFIFVL